MKKKQQQQNDISTEQMNEMNINCRLRNMITYNKRSSHQPKLTTRTLFTLRMYYTPCESCKVQVGRTSDRLKFNSVGEQRKHWPQNDSINYGDQLSVERPR